MLITSAFSLDRAIDRHPLTVTPDSPVYQVIALMSQARASCVLVVERQQIGADDRLSIIGIFTERDLVKITAQERSIEGVTIAEVMTHKPFTLKEAEAQDILTLLKLFRQAKFRHLPIVDDQSTLVGLITHQSLREVLQPADWMRLRRVTEVMTTQVIQAPSTISLIQLTQLMAQKRVSSVVIVQNAQGQKSTETQEADRSLPQSASIPVGIITERDILQFRALGLDFYKTKAETVMSSPLLPIRSSDSLIAAHEKMRQQRIRRLVVLGDAGELIGVITQTSLLQALDPIEVDASVGALQRVIEERTAELVQTNKRLEQEISEHQKTEAALRLSEGRLAGILNIAQDAVISVDEQMCVQLFNQGAEKIFGYTAAEVLQQPIDLLLPPGFTKAHRQHIFSLYKPADGGQQMAGRREIWLRRKDRTEFPAEASISKLDLPEGTVWTVILRDISDRKRTEEALRHQMARERLLASLSLRIRQSLDINTILNTTVAEVRQFLKADRVIIYRFQPDWSGVIAVESVGPGWVPILGTTIHDVCFAANYLDRYENGRIEAIEDIYTSGISQCRIDLLAPLQVRANLVVPILKETRAAEGLVSTGVLSEAAEQPHDIVTQNSVQAKHSRSESSAITPKQSANPDASTTIAPSLWGLLGVHQCSRARRWQEWEIDLLKQLATQVAIALQQAELYQKLLAANQQLLELASSDGLTLVANRRRFDEYLNQEWRRLVREREPLSLILCDVDFFKAYNDTYGHIAGDICLQKVAEAIRQATRRPADLVARYGGEEFAVILPNTHSAGAVYVAEQIRAKVATMQIEHPNSQVSQFITLSLGVGSTIPDYQSSPAQLIAAADQALYEAKAQGRDRTVAHNV
ncbi:diguanylate cyclase [Planktothrix sp. FACHB-1355]|uniref:Diguanylate cyclase n=1 Tax=Aerosakkonema funiforme FACHB-1375 TaxID=2949571 RepID=A0A926VF12_9CYAN|nr:MULTISPECIES: diguanylate cyclase [Oscillatoriales]MBD2182537.1 diguanylate cyclase [Aerosakkonema funiforme FACHB-1375]MBD3559601.1 diguanylate cyclase [Planktothrix sp. FACHB-1355]